MPTASGDADRYIRRFYRAFGALRCRPAHLPLFERKAKDPGKVLRAQDLIYVGGGNTANLLAIWRVHGLEAPFREAWQQGVVLCGVSAGAICWFEGGVTDSFGRPLRPLEGGLGFLSGSFCPHYDGEPDRRATFHRLVRAGRLPSGFAADDGAAILFEDSRIADVVASRRRVGAYRVRRDGTRMVEERLEARLLAR